MNPIPPAIVVRPDHHIFLSPHYDDIALSSGGTASFVAQSGKDVQIVVVFAGGAGEEGELTDFARSQHEDWDLSDDRVTSLRMDEEHEAAARLGASVELLSFQDAIYRGNRYLNDAALFGEPHPDEAELLVAIRDEIVDRQSCDSVRYYAPLGIGHHVDHLHVYQAGMSLVDAGKEVWFYEDMPYGLLPDLREVRFSEIADSIEPMGLVDCTSVWNNRIDAIMSYASQIGVIFRHVAKPAVTRLSIDAALRHYAGSFGENSLVERYWIASA